MIVLARASATAMACDPAIVTADTASAAAMASDAATALVAVTALASATVTAPASAWATAAVTATALRAAMRWPRLRPRRHVAATDPKIVVVDKTSAREFASDCVPHHSRVGTMMVGTAQERLCPPYGSSAHQAEPAGADIKRQHRGVGDVEAFDFAGHVEPRHHAAGLARQLPQAFALGAEHQRQRLPQRDRAEILSCLRCRGRRS